MNLRQQQAAAAKQAAAWNAKNPIGTMVSYESVIGMGETHRARTRTEAQVLSGHTAVVWLGGKSDCVCLDHCTVVPDEQEGAL